MAFHNSPPDPSKVWILSKLNICFSCLPNQARSNLYLCFYGLLGSNDALFGLDGHILAPTYQDPKRRHLRQRRKTYQSPPYYGGNNPDFNLCPVIFCLVIFSPRIIERSVWVGKMAFPRIGGLLRARDVILGGDKKLNKNEIKWEEMYIRQQAIASPVLILAASHLWERRAAPKWNIWRNHKKAFSILGPSDTPLLTVDKFVFEHIRRIQVWAKDWIRVFTQSKAAFRCALLFAEDVTIIKPP